MPALPIVLNHGHTGRLAGCTSRKGPTSGHSAKNGRATATPSKAARTKGTVKYDEENNIDQMRSWRLTLETANNRRILTEILVSAEKRLYIVEANTPINVPPPAQFQASVQILDADGVRIRYKTVGSSERVR